MNDIYEFFGHHSIPYKRHDHPAVFTCAEAELLVPDLPAAKTKNLFLRDNNGKRHFLVIVSDDKTVDMKTLRDRIGSSKLSMGSAERLKKHLGITPGSVSILALVNDPKHAVEVIIDADLWKADSLRFHPLVNTSTLVISRQAVERFVTATGHAFKILDITQL